MAVGDVISGIAVSPATYQPAAGVEVLVTAVATYSNGGPADVRPTDGANTARFSNNASYFGPGTDQMNMKLFFTNSVYLTAVTSSVGQFVYWSGVQIK
tara:strand:- start:21 stop:314 length:294 start_codon:yes stop_codon:yes gene_type:complete